MKRIKTWFSNF